MKALPTECLFCIVWTIILDTVMVRSWWHRSDAPSCTSSFTLAPYDRMPHPVPLPSLWLHMTRSPFLYCFLHSGSIWPDAPSCTVSFASWSSLQLCSECARGRRQITSWWQFSFVIHLRRYRHDLSSVSFPYCPKNPGRSETALTATEGALWFVTTSWYFKVRFCSPLNQNGQMYVVNL